MPEHDSLRSGAPPSLKDAAWLRRPEVEQAFAALSGGGVETRAVGGAVRDALLGIEVTEVDLATTATPEQVMTLARKAGLKAVPTGIEHGTVTVIADTVPFEVTTLRRDVETYGRHAKVAFTKDWIEDAQRRDFTLNALYADCDGSLFDPIGGYADLKAGRVRFIGSAEDRIKEDYLRILRFFRFNAYYGSGPVDGEGLRAAVRLRCGLGQLSGERVGAEMRRLLVAPRAMRAVQSLYDYGLITELLGGVPRLDPFAKLIAIEAALGFAAYAMTRLAALAVFVEEDVPRLAARFKLSNSEQSVLALGARGTGDALLPEENAAKRLLYAIAPGRFGIKVLLTWAQSGAGPDREDWRDAYDLPKRWEVPKFPVRGSDLAETGKLRGPALGEVLRALEAAWIESGFALTREALLARAATLT
ncbi:MAG: CCA tRNA nucleotidyltransferase [Methyloceanibacter sp.]